MKIFERSEVIGQNWRLLDGATQIESVGLSGREAKAIGYDLSGDGTPDAVTLKSGYEGFSHGADRLIAVRANVDRWHILPIVDGVIGAMAGSNWANEGWAQKFFRPNFP